MSTRQNDLALHPHRRFNPLKGEWVLVSPHRNRRPWQGAMEATRPEEKPAHDPECYLCGGNTRANGERNPEYQGPWVFANDFPALLPDTPDNGGDNGGLFIAKGVHGTARVICFSERHDLTLPELPVSGVRQVVDVWADEIETLGQAYKWVAVFENKGAMMGCSNPHPHGQVWASDFLPNEVAQEDACQKEYFQTHGQALLADYAKAELDKGERMVVENSHWVAVVPYWAVWPFETLVLPRRPIQRLADLGDEERSALADLIKRLTTRYDNLFKTEFPYSMGWHGAPNDSGDYRYWQLHAHFFPPLLRSATVRKFMVGYEMLAEAQRDLTAETAAEKLRKLPDVHYKQR
jgi:UDPglucose--hexose-1-phosphate uridylyltransferase|tara:strand:- start:2470 stop:3516 length:1047 start_codon:yes stop_codon:yes gene_type:complete